uniref:Ig-like domain-containing protein n=1 Tax=Photinus pyralis TaxID=7054 RepID=A0A1Y1L1L5_PHOPY
MLTVQSIRFFNALSFSPTPLTFFDFPVIPQIMPFTFGEESLNEGEAASAQCTITKGDLPVELIWYLNGRVIDEDNGILTSNLGKRTKTLAIDSVQARHIGEYTCRAMNSAGSTNFTTYLNVNGSFFTTMLLMLSF